MFCKINNKRKSVTEIVSAIMLLIAAFFPGFMIVNPPLYGKYFKTFGAIELAVFPVLLIFNIVLKCVVEKPSFKGLISEWILGVKKSFSVNRHFLLLSVAFVLAVISACMAVDTKRAFFGTDFRPDGIYMYSVFAVIFIYGSNIHSRKLKNAVYAMYIFSFLLNGAIMLQQYVGVIGTVNADSCPQWLLFLKNKYDDLGIRTGFYYKGLTGGFYNSNHIGYFLMICSLIISSWFVVAKRIWVKAILGILCVYSVWLVIINDTFGCYIALFVGLLLMTLLCTCKVKTERFLLGILFPMIVFVTLSVGMTISGDATVIRNFVKLESDIEKISTEDSGAGNAGSGRWELWVATFDMIEREPVLGYGPDNVNTMYKRYGLDLTRAHSEYLEHPLNCGIPFAVFYLSGVFYIIIKRIKRMKTAEDVQKYLIPLAASVGYMVSAFFGVFLFYTACHFIVTLSLLKD